MSECQVCGAKTDAFMCKACWNDLEPAFWTQRQGDVSYKPGLPMLINDVATMSLRETKVYRANAERVVQDEELSELEEEYAWRAATLPARLRSRMGRVTLSGSPDVVNVGASRLLASVRNTLITWARHLTESRGVELALNVGASTEGPVCAAHVHDMRPKGCGHHVDPETGFYDCRRLHCAHASCDRIRHGELTGVAAALCRWFVLQREAIRFDEAAADLYEDILNLRDRLIVAVDSTSSPTWVGPCRAVVDEACCARDLYAWEGKDEILCDGYRSDDVGCGTVHNPEDRDDWLTGQLAHALIGIPEMLAALPKLFPTYPRPPKTVAQAWVRQGRLMAHGKDHVGEPTYVGGEMLELIANYRPHKYAPRPRRCA